MKQKKLFSISLSKAVLFAAFVFCIFHFNITTAQTPNVLWAKSAGGTYLDYTYSCTTDASGNIIVTGSFASPNITFGTTTLTNAGGTEYDVFIVKYDASGNVLWAKSAGGTGNDECYGCSTDANGNIIITGHFDSPFITFGTTTLSNVFMYYSDMFIVKYDASGNVLWAKSTGGTGDEWSRSCSTDANGNIIVTGCFSSSSLSFGATTLNNALDGYRDIFIVKYDASGNALWAKSAGNSGTDIGFDCTTDANGNIIVTGIFDSFTITFGTTTLTYHGKDDIFIVKYDASGNVLWAKSAGGASDDNGNICSTDINENIIVTGYFSSSSITFGTTTLTNVHVNVDQLFVVKYDASGNVLWAKSAGGNGSVVSYSSCSDNNKDIIITGMFSSDSINFGTIVLANSGNMDVFIVKYDASGNALWAINPVGGYLQTGYGCSTDANGNIFISGIFADYSITFGTTTLTNVSPGHSDIFVVKYDAGGVGINEMNTTSFFSIYPNPAGEELKIQSPKFQVQNSKEAEYNIYNSLGQLLLSGALKQEETTLNIKGLAKGMYLLKVKNGEEITVNKFMKE